MGTLREKYSHGHLFQNTKFSTQSLQGRRRKGGAEGVNAPSIFGKLHQWEKIRECFEVEAELNAFISLLSLQLDHRQNHWRRRRTEDYLLNQTSGCANTKL